MSEWLYSVESPNSLFTQISELVAYTSQETPLAVSNSAFKIVVYLESQVTLSIRGAGRWKINPGDAMVFPGKCKQIYTPHGKQSEGKLHAFRLTAETLPSSPPHSKQTPENNLSVFIQHHFKQIRHFPAFGTPHIKELITKIRQEAEKKPPGYSHQIHALSTELTLELARCSISYKTQELTQQLPDRTHVIDKTKNYILENLTTTLTLDQIAWNVRLSGEHLSRIFKELTGQTIFQYITQMRIEEVKRLLLTSSDTVTQIAGQTGFQSSVVLIRNFKSLVGMTPQVYRKSTQVHFRKSIHRSAEKK